MAYNQKIRVQMLKGKFLNKVRKTITSNHLLHPKDKVLAGVSGGPDSVALVQSLVMLASEYGWQIAVVHLNHGLRSESDDEAGFVSSLAQGLGLPLYLQKTNVRTYQKKHRVSLEEAARDVRRRFFYETARAHGYSKIALGHHANDNAELILMNLLRGSGPQGLAGMPPRASFYFKGNETQGLSLVRPLIHCERREIDGFLRQHQFSFVLDASNSDLCYRRNRIRHELIPMLQKRYNPNVVDTLSRMAGIIDSENTWMGQLAAQAMTDAILERSTGGLTLSISKIVPAPLALRRQIVRHAISGIKGTLRKIGHTHIETVLQLMEKGPQTGCLDLPDRIRVVREGDRIIISLENIPLRQLPPRSALPVADSFEYHLTQPGSYTLDKLGMQISISQYRASQFSGPLNAGHRVAFFDMKAVSFPLMIRNVRPGDRFKPLGMDGTCKIHRFFSDRKIPVNERIRCPLLLSRGRVIWVVGHRIDDSAKITPDTQHIVKVALELA